MKINTRDILGISLLILIVVLIVNKNSVRIDGFEDIKVDPATMKMAQEIIKEKNNAGEANESFRKVLAFIENNPGGATSWLGFIKSNFFEPDAKFKKDLSFKGISDRWRPMFKDAMPEQNMDVGLLGMPKK